MAKEKLSRIYVRVPDKLKKKLEKDAASQKISFNQHITYALELISAQGLVLTPSLKSNIPEKQRGVKLASN